MNIFNKVTLQNLKKSRTRTVVTIIGVMLSVAMITAVTTFISSLQSYLVQMEMINSGDWHVEFTDVDAAFAERLAADSGVKNTAVTQNIGYALLDGSLNPSKPYLFVTGLNDAAFDMMPVHITAGRLPQNSGEIVIPEHLETDGGVRYLIGDTITLPLGRRMIGGEVLGQRKPYQNGETDGDAVEIFMPEYTATYTVVGVCAGPSFEIYSAPGYTLITMTDARTSLSGSFDVFAALKNPGTVYDFAEKTAGDYGYMFNSSLLRFMGVSNNDNFNTVLYSLGAILIALIVIGSVLLIYNSFAISVSERSREFGILSSVGATRKQLRKSVLFEGLCIGCIGIPGGILAGLAGIGITLRFVGSLIGNMMAAETHAPLALTPSFPALVIAAAVGILTILISAYIPAKRAVKKSAIDIIRQADDIKINAKEIKTAKLTGRLFGLEGALASKNFKRNKKRYRSTVLSLFVSVVLFIAASAFGMYLTQSANMTITDVGYDIALNSYQSNWHMDDEQLLRLYDRMRMADGVYRAAYLSYVNCSAPAKKSDFTERYHEFLPNLSNVRDDATCYLSVNFIDNVTYQRYLESLGLSPDDYGITQGKLVAVAKYTGYDPVLQRTVDIDIFNEKEITLDVTAGSTFEQWGNVPSQKIDLTIVETVPEGFSLTSYGVDAFAPYSDISKFQAPKEAFNGLSMTFSSHDPMKSAAEMEAIMKDTGIVSGYSLYNAAESLEQNRNILLIINIFTYGFVILISLITIANVFNTVSTSINLRRREFAMLRSVGLNNRGFNKIMNFECIFYGLKALLYGLPAAACVTFLIYLAVLKGVDVSYSLPWGSVGISVLSVFFVVFVTMLYAVGKVKKANVIDALRDDMM